MMNVRLIDIIGIEFKNFIKCLLCIKFKNQFLIPITMESNEPKDPALWKMAVKRANFRRHLQTYVIINAFFWAIWFFTGRMENGGVPWPVWPALGWGLGLAFNYFNAYHGDKDSSAEEEYRKLTGKNQ